MGSSSWDFPWCVKKDEMVEPKRVKLGRSSMDNMRSCPCVVRVVLFEVLAPETLTKGNIWLILCSVLVVEH